MGDQEDRLSTSERIRRIEERALGKLKREPRALRKLAWVERQGPPTLEDIKWRLNMLRAERGHVPIGSLDRMTKEQWQERSARFDSEIAELQKMLDQAAPKKRE